MAEGLDCFIVFCVAGQMVAAQSFDGYDCALVEKLGGFRDWRLG